ncbi:C4orf17 [Columba guinea]|nr:C4orf17 [Columba guinea]
MCSSAVSTGAVLEPPCITSADQLGHPRLPTAPNPQKDVGPYNREGVTCAISKKVLPTRRPARKEITYSSSGSETSLSVTPALTRSPDTHFKSMYEPQFEHNMWEDQQHSQSGCSAETYYDSRNNPHPKMVRHIRGINNALICFVRTSFSRADPSAGDTGVPRQEAHQERVLTGNATSNTSANRCLPKLEGFVRGELRTPESLTQKDDIFRLIYSEPTDEGMLNSKEGTAETMRSPSLQKPLSPLQRSPEGIRSQSSKGETASFALNIEKQRSSTSSPTAPREELQLRKRYGNKRPCCFTVCRSLTCATATPDNTNPLSLEPPVQSH